MKTLPSVAIGVPVFGVEKYIERCARSLLSQTYQTITYYFVNDCTKDKSLDLLKTVIADYPQRQNDIFIINHEKNRGLAASRNTVLDLACADFIMWVDSDDWLEYDAVERAVEKQLLDNADIVNLGYIEHSKRYNKIVMPSHFATNVDFMKSVMSLNTPHFIWSRLIRLKLYTDNKIRCIEGVNMAEDWQVLPIIAYYAKTISSVQEVLCHYNCMNQNSYSKTRSEELNHQYWLSFENNKNFFGDKDESCKEAIKVMELTVAIDRLINYAKYRYDFYYEESIKHIIRDKKVWKKIPFIKRMILYIYPNKIALIMYVITLSLTHHCILSIKSYFNEDGKQK